MKREFRLTRSTEFKRVRREGKSYAHPLVVLVAAPNAEGKLHVGITASRAVGGAVLRNLVRRRLKASFDEFLPVMRTGWDVVVIARQPAAQAAYLDLRSGIARLLKQADLLVER